jgi:hypothetical protein
VIVKSVTACTRVVSPSAVSVLTIVAWAPPWPRLSVPFARIVAVWVDSSASSILTVPRYAAVVGPSLTLNSPW